MNRSDISALAMKLSRAVSKAVRVGQTGSNGEKKIPFFCRLNFDLSEIEAKWGVTLESDRSVHGHPSSLVDRQGSEKSKLRHTLAHTHARARTWARWLHAATAVLTVSA